MISPYGYAKSFHVRSFSLAVFLGLAFYYTAIVFHWQYFAFTDIPYWITFPMIVCIPLVSKGGMWVRVKSHQKSSVKAWKAVGLVTYYLMMTIATISFALFIIYWFRNLVSTVYWAKMHWFWESAFLLLLFIFPAYAFHRRALLTWPVLQDLKAIPIVSPAFCFGAPIMWSNNLAYATLPKETLSAYGSLSIAAGIIFLLYWVAYAIGNQFSINPEATVNSMSILGADGNSMRPANQHKEQITWICFGIFYLALYLFSLVLFDAMLRLAF